MAEKLQVASATQIVTTTWLRAGYKTQVTQATASGLIFLLCKENILKRVSLGKYLIDKVKLEAFYKDKRFYCASHVRTAAVEKISQIGGDEKRTNDVFKRIPSDEEHALKATPTKNTSVCNEDLNIINELLDVLARVEPVLQKYKKICELANS